MTILISNAIISFFERAIDALLCLSLSKNVWLFLSLDGDIFRREFIYEYMGPYVCITIHG